MSKGQPMPYHLEDDPAVIALRAQVARLERAMPPANSLRILADWFDADDANKGGGRGQTVQKDLRKWANAIDSALLNKKIMSITESGCWLLTGATSARRRRRSHDGSNV